MLKKFLFSFLFAAMSSMGIAANVVVLDDSTSVETSLTDAVFTYKRTLLVPDATGKGALLWSSTLDKNMKLKNFSASYTSLTGKTVRKFKKSDLQMTELSAGLGDDNTTYYFAYMPPTYPVVVTFEWTVENHGGVIAYPMFCPMQDYDEEVEHASYTIKCPADNPCRYQAVNCDSLLGPSGVSKKGKLIITRGQDGTVKAVFDHIPALVRESYSRSLIEQVPRVLFAADQFEYWGTKGRLNTWQNFGLWQYGLLKGRSELPGQIKEKVHGLTDGVPSKREKIARLYQYLYENTRYVSIQLGIGGYQPATAMEVATNGFGDCKGLSNYMIALLKEAGIPAFYAAISTQYADLLPNFPNLNQLNHAIAGVPMEKDTLWLECTNARFPLGYVHEDIAGHQALVITENGGKLVRLPDYADTDNLQKSSIRLKVGNNGTVDMDCQVERTNRQYEDVLPMTSMDATNLEKSVLENIYFPAAQIKTLKVEEAKGKPLIHTTLIAQSEKYANRVGKRLFIKVNPLKANGANISKQVSRHGPICLDYGYCDEEEIVVDIPEGYQVESLPQNRNIESKYSTFNVTFRQEGQQVHVTYRLVMHRGTYPASDYPAFVKTRNEIAQAYRQQIVVVEP